MGGTNEAGGLPPPLELVRMYFGTRHPLFRAMDISIVSMTDGRAEMTMPCTPGMCDARGALHRGAMVTLLDNTCGLSIFSALGTVRAIATIDLRVDYFHALPPGVGVRTVVDCVNTTETVAYISGRACTLDEAALPLAAVTGTFAINTMGPALEGILPGAGRERSA